MDKCVFSVYDDMCMKIFFLCAFFQEDDMPEEVNIDDLIDLPNDEERVKKLKVNLFDQVITQLETYYHCILCIHNI